ncbi:MaoC family dehydratase N-terminal domain-containing protein [Halobacillus salinarum]|uniref:MaoC family dehydratase N-terminal domain-containing protein n=1 Tax=Halobacillus salinarum TaxID=2932257 RepID=A0ABY4EN56_9BACI|nr:MaoC family dehydratase N-terminal domain-containing protein [Halobacillus salinarum]UOQ45047.1 MaoC family dehydratase N-terminal domain-containing protein [Halobacillus salinarum]
MKTWIGYKTETIPISVDKGQAMAFAKSIELDHPVYFDELSARKEGYEDIPLPPTMIISFWHRFHLPWLKNDQGVIHAEQHFSYYHYLLAGRTYGCNARVEDVFRKKGRKGPMLFVVQTLDVFMENELHATASSTLLFPEEGDCYGKL